MLMLSIKELVCYDSSFASTESTFTAKVSDKTCIKLLVLSSFWAV